MVNASGGVRLRETQGPKNRARTGMIASSPLPPISFRVSRSRRVLGLVTRHWATALFCVISATLFGWVTWEAMYLRMITWESGADYWEHSATLHSLIENPWHPRHPHLATFAGSPRFGPQFLLVALIARALHWDAIQAMALASVLNTALFLSGIYALCRVYFRHRLAPLYGLFVMFGAWWVAFHFSNVYSLPQFFSVSAFPSTTALGLTFHGFALATRTLRRAQREPQWLRLLALGVWAAAVLIVHPLTAAMSLSGAVLLAVVDPRVPLRRRAEVMAAVIVGSALAHFWPYFSPWVVLRGGHGEAADWASESVKQATELYVKPQRHKFYKLYPMLNTLGLAVVTVACLPYFAWKRERWFIALGTVSMLLPFAVNAFIELPLGHRFLLLAMVYLHLGLIWLALGLTPGHRRSFPWVRFRWVGVITSLFVAATLLVFFSHSVQQAYHQQSVRRYYGEIESPVVLRGRLLAELVGPKAVILATPATSWPIPTFGPRVLVLFHEDPLVRDAREREAEVRRFLRPGLSDEQRWAILHEYGVTHVVLARGEGGGAVGFLGENSEERSLGGPFRLYTLKH